ncbi:MAG: hypothetical protein H7A51_00215 [Akkermansiaceae bacterium]|nr:hypothetical protein [Akkermansiaceae bacterium]
MKQKIILTLAGIAGLALVPLIHARTWTSADGKSQFDGEYVSSTGTSVTVKKNGIPRTFKIDLLSEDDKKWIAENKERIARETREKAAMGNIDDQKIGKKLKGKTVRAVNGKFVNEDTGKVPQYYLLYFTASW